MSNSSAYTISMVHNAEAYESAYRRCVGEEYFDFSMDVYVHKNNKTIINFWYEGRLYRQWRDACIQIFDSGISYLKTYEKLEKNELEEIALEIEKHFNNDTNRKLKIHKVKRDIFDEIKRQLTDEDY